MKSEAIIDKIKNVSHKLKWNDLEKFCSERNYPIQTSKKGYKVYIGQSVWSVHLEHRTSEQLKHGIIRQLKNILIKEGVLNV